MRVSLLVTAAIIASTLAATPAVAAYDRPPITVSGLAPDIWGQTITNAEDGLRGRFRGIDSVYCTGAMQYGNEGYSSFMRGIYRYWDKLACGGWTRAGHTFALIYDAKGVRSDSWTIYRLKGIGVAELRYG